MMHFVFATDRPWALNAFANARHRLPGDWIVVTSPTDLRSALELREPRYVFFPHWSHIVPSAILDKVECVCFHMTNVPYGRGGSPLQNLIARGHRETVLTALRMTEEIDAGPVYLKQPLSLTGAAEDIFERAASQTLDLVERIVREEPAPTPQENADAVKFARRKPSQSALPDVGDIEETFDHIRMLDASGYPKAFIDNGPFRITFSDARLDENGVVRIQGEITENVDPAHGEVELRNAVFADCGRVFRWRYSENSAQFYVSSDVPSYQDHVTWMTNSFSNPDRTVLIGSVQGLAVSHVRFDHGASETEISIYVDPARRGKRVGSRTLRAAINRHKQDRYDKLVAWVHADNAPSLGLFSACGFVEVARAGAFVRFELPTHAAEE